MIYAGTNQLKPRKNESNCIGMFPVSQTTMGTGLQGTCSVLLYSCELHAFVGRPGFLNMRPQWQLKASEQERGSFSSYKSRKLSNCSKSDGVILSLKMK